MEKKSRNYSSLLREAMDRTTLSPSLSSSDPLISTIITLYTLISLYFPGTTFLGFTVFSPLLILSATLFFSLLQLGNSKHRSEEQVITQTQITDKQKSQMGISPDQKTMMGLNSGLNPNPFYVREPLEVIYEAHEGDEEEIENDGVLTEPRFAGIERHPSLSMYYPESDSDSSSEGDFPAMGTWDLAPPERMCFRRHEEEEEERDGLIEIKFDGMFEFEEESLIEIDLSPAAAQ